MRASKYTETLLAPVVKSSRSLAEVLRKLGLKPTGGNHRYIAARVRHAGLDTSHFSGRGWSRGFRRATHTSVDRVARKHTRSDGEVFVECSPVLNTKVLRRRLLAIGWLECCAVCGIADWLGTKLVMHLDHINGLSNDNRLENLRFLCPNCHSQTPTYCRRPRC